MSYTALYRKYRPLDFDQMVGQDDVVQIIKSQILNKNTAHAYIFSGTRGTGKTTAAKLLARAINCLNPNGYNPCNVCEICRSIMDESIMDVIEMDAASNNGVDDVREIRENCKFPPAKARKKIYIIDEVHMLSNGAFNALLKTLEEPPSYMVFILATTEPHKIPITIQSRCQKYNFTRISNTVIQNLLNGICQKESVAYDDKGTELITRKADGSVRDALSILDQCVSSGSGATYDQVKRLLSAIDDELLIDTADAILKKDLSKALLNVDQVLNQGLSINQFAKDLQDVFRDLLIMRAGEAALCLIEKSDQYVSDLLKISKNGEIKAIIDGVEGLAKAPNNRINLEIMVAKLCVESTVKAPIPQVMAIDPPRKSVQHVSTPIHVEPTIAPLPVIEIQSGQVSLEDLKNNWDKILKELKKRKVTINAFLIEGRPHEITGNKLIIAFPDGYGFHMSAVMKEENKSIIEDVLSKLFQKNLKIDCNFLSNLEHNNGNQVEQSDNIEKVKEIFADYSELLKIED